MNDNYRIIDANLNRASEALRVIEEIARFKLNNQELTSKLKNLRHKINTKFSDQYLTLLNARDSEGDIGLTVTNTSARTDLIDILKANFKRAQQALRTLEEYVKIENSEADNTFELSRYELYSLEKNMHSEIINVYKKKKLESCKLYLVTDRKKFSDLQKFYDAIAKALQGGVDIVQLREKDTPVREFIEIARFVKELCTHYNKIFIINDRVDVAMAVNADGVHLGQEDMDLLTARKILGHEAIIGNSTHKPEDALSAMKNGADYIGVGPVFSTPTKPGRQAVGYEYVKWASQNVNIPFFAIGGINPENIEEVIEAGATRIAAVRAIINADDPAEISLLILEKLNKERSRI